MKFLISSVWHRLMCIHVTIFKCMFLLPFWEFWQDSLFYPVIFHHFLLNIQIFPVLFHMEDMQNRDTCVMTSRLTADHNFPSVPTDPIPPSLNLSSVAENLLWFSIFDHRSQRSSHTTLLPPAHPNIPASNNSRHSSLFTGTIATAQARETDQCITQLSSEKLPPPAERNRCRDPQPHITQKERPWNLQL